ncbi:MAG: hypothetical protein V1779_12730 [bacterium]
MKLSIIFIIVSILIPSNLVYSQTEFYPAKTIDIRFFGGKSSGTSFFDLDGETTFELPDKSLDDEQPERDYIFEYSSFESGIKVEYAPIENLVIFSEIPVVYHTLLQKADTMVYYISDTVNITYDSISYKKQTADYSLFQTSYFSIGGRYKFYSKLAYVAALAELRIPPGFHQGIQNDPDYTFLSDGALEIHTGFLLGIKFEKGWLESAFSYHYRGEELVDYVNIHTEFGLTTVPGSKLGAQLDFIQSLGNFNEAVEFEPRLTTLQENLLQAGFMFQLFITDNWYVDFSYKVNLIGKNALNKSGYLIGAGIRL